MIVASGCMPLEVTRFCDLIAGTEAMQQWAGVSTAAAARDHVRAYRAGKERLRRPLVVVAEEAFRYGQSAYINRVVLCVLIKASLPKEIEADDADCNIEFGNHRDAVIRSVLQEGELDPYWLPFDPFSACESMTQVMRSEKTETPPYLEQWIRFTYGVK